MRNVWREESGTALLLVLALLAMGPLLLTPMLLFTFAAQKSGQIQTRVCSRNIYALFRLTPGCLWVVRSSGDTLRLQHPACVRGVQMESSLAVSV